jgi:hypothetical protein
MELDDSINGLNRVPSSPRVRMMEPEIESECREGSAKSGLENEMT